MYQDRVVVSPPLLADGHRVPRDILVHAPGAA